MPDEPPKYATTAEVSAAAGVSRVSIWRWVQMGLLPEPARYSDGRTGVKNRWPAWAVERAAWVRKKRTELTLEEVVTLVRANKAPGPPPPAPDDEPPPVDADSTGADPPPT